jgi:hypothetical protein
MRKLVFIILFILMGMVLVPAALFAGSGLVGKTLYLQSNLWFVNPSKINAVNYHRGTMLEAGTRVRIDSMSSRRIEFVTTKNGLEYRIIFSRKYFPRIKIEEYASWYFGPKNPLRSSAYAGFSATEKKGIEEGLVKKGMSKRAVIMACGQPARHRTRSTEFNTWNYWTPMRMEVRFGKDGRVAQIIGGRRR